MFSEADRAILSQFFLFSGMTDSELSSFCKGEFCKTVCFKKGESLLESDENRLGILLSGKATALPTEEGKGALKTFFPGELFGAASVFCDGNCPPLSHIVAKTACRVLFISRQGVESLFLAEPNRAIEYIRFLSGRVEFLNRRISTFTSKETAVRVARYILKTADSDGICRKINFSALAKSLGISRASLYRAKNELVNLKAISVNGRDITVLDTDALNNIN